MGPSENDLLGLVKTLATRAGRSEPVALERLSAGRNNQVYRLTGASGEVLFLKSYFTDPRDTRPRLAAEWSFLDYAWARGIRDVPQPIAADFDLKLGLYEFIDGSKLSEPDVDWSHLQSAARFILALNVKPRNFERLPAASEACMSIAEHIATVDRRVQGLEQLHPEVPHREAAAQFVGTRLTAIWQRVRARIADEVVSLRIDVDARLDAEDVIASPSDFGFHNMLQRADGTLVFTDFEYAGIDDPAKLVCDFFAQPDLPAPIEHLPAFIDMLSEGLNLAPHHARRCALLLDAYRVKWACIILNDFRPVGARQRAFARADSWSQRCATQLAKAEAKIAQVSTVARGAVR